jgi:pyruvate dehydrogenase E1 component alpha subunit
MADATAVHDTDPDVMLFRVLREDGTVDPSIEHRFSDEVALRAYVEMRRLRALDARMVLLQRQGRIGFYGAATGQEVVPIVSGLVLEPEDWVFPALREQSVMLARGYPLRDYLAQAFGNVADNLKGRQPPCHQAGKKVHQVSWSPVIGPQIPQAVGAAMAMKIKRAGSIAVAYLGDGATSGPEFHNAMNFAGVYKAPCVIVCQNNHWSISVPTSRQTASATIAIKGRAYGVPAVRVDGNDALAVHKVLSEAFDHARSGRGPVFVEAVTYRMGAHTTSDDPKRYRSDAEVDAWTKKDPIDRLRRYLETRGLMDDARDHKIESDTTQEMSRLLHEVEGMPGPPLASMFDDVYAELPWSLREQRAEAERAVKYASSHVDDAPPHALEHE